jgi:hypothetical protein
MERTMGQQHPVVIEASKDFSIQPQADAEKSKIEQKVGQHPDEDTVSLPAVRWRLEFHKGH